MKLAATMKLGRKSLPLWAACSLCACGPALSSQTPLLVDSTWHSSYAFRNMTGDGRPDSLALVAKGRHMDSLTISFTIHVGGQMVHRQFWKSRWYFWRPPMPPARTWTSEAKLNELQKEFAEFFSEARFVHLSTEKNTDTLSNAVFERRVAEYLGGGPNDILMLAGLSVDSADAFARRLRANPVDSAEVSAIAQQLREANPITFSYYRGEENSSVIAWSNRTRSFVRIHSCC